MSKINVLEEQWNLHCGRACDAAGIVEPGGLDVLLFEATSLVALLGAYHRTNSQLPDSLKGYLDSTIAALRAVRGER